MLGGDGDEGDDYADVEEKVRGHGLVGRATEADVLVPQPSLHLLGVGAGGWLQAQTNKAGAS